MAENVLHLGLVEDEAIQLDAAALELAALDHPGADLEPYLATLNTMVERLADLGGAARTSEARAKLLARVLAIEHGLTGDRSSYDDPANADLICVLDRGQGLPVSLSILYVAAARRMGWEADALNTPGHVLVRVGNDVSPVLIDPFNGGRIVAPDQLATLLTQMLGRDTPPAAEHIAPLSNRGVLTRLLLNQATRAEAAGDRQRALVLFERMTAIAPHDVHALWERSRLQLAAGNVAAARASLLCILEVSRDAALRTRVADVLGSLGGSGGS